MSKLGKLGSQSGEKKIINCLKLPKTQNKPRFFSNFVGVGLNDFGKITRWNFPTLPFFKGEKYNLISKSQSWPIILGSFLDVRFFKMVVRFFKLYVRFFKMYVRFLRGIVRFFKMDVRFFKMDVRFFKDFSNWM